MNPYMHQNFFSFFEVLGRRLLAGFPGPIYSDKIQLAVLSGVAISSVLVGSFLVVRRMTMLANSLSHTTLLGIVLCFFIVPTSTHSMPLPLLMAAAAIMGIVTTWLTQGLQRMMQLQEDASIGLIFSLLFALGLFLVSLYTRNVHAGTELIMGNADALIASDVRLTWMTVSVNVVMTLILLRSYLLTSFDPLMARAAGISSTGMTYLLMSQAALTTVSAFRCIGVFMVLAFLVVPVLAARLFCTSLYSLAFFGHGMEFGRRGGGRCVITSLLKYSAPRAFYRSFDRDAALFFLLHSVFATRLLYFLAKRDTT